MEDLKDFILAHIQEDVLPFEAELMASQSSITENRRRGIKTQYHAKTLYVE